MSLLRPRGQEIMLRCMAISSCLCMGFWINQEAFRDVCMLHFWVYVVGWAFRTCQFTLLWDNCLGLTDCLVMELFKFIALCVAIMSLFLAFGQCEFSCVAAVISGLHQLSEFVSRYWKSEFCMHHLCSCYVGHLSARLLISSHLAVRSQNNMMDI